MKILLLAAFSDKSTENKYGGAEKVITNLANWLSENTDNKVVLASVEGHGKPYSTNNNVIFDSFSLNKNTNKLKIHLQILRNTKLVLNKYKPEIVISFYIYPMFFAQITSLFKNIKFFYSERNDPRLEYGLIARIMRWFVMKRSDGIVFQTNEAMNYFPEYVKKKSVVIHNPVRVDEKKYSLPTKTDNRIVTIGRLFPQKNHKLLINAFNQIKDLYPETTLEIHGDGVLRNELQEHINDLSLNNRVFLKHSRPDVLDYIYGASLFVLPSLYEGMPNTLMEAMALGIPVISSDCPCGGPRELIEDGKNGYLFKNNELDDLVSCMKRVLDIDYPKEMCKEARKICLTHSSDYIFKKWIEFIEFTKNSFVKY